MSARYFDPAAVAAERKYQEKEVGVVLMPTWGMAQCMALYDSLSGPYLRQYLAHQLMTPVGYVKTSSDNTLGKQQQRVLDDVTATPKPVPPPPPTEKK